MFKVFCSEGCQDRYLKSYCSVKSKFSTALKLKLILSCSGKIFLCKFFLDICFGPKVFRKVIKI